MNRLALLPMTGFLMLVVLACEESQSPNPILAEAYQDGWNDGITYVVCVLADGSGCLYAEARPAGDSMKKAYDRGHEHGLEKAKDCTKKVIKSISHDLWEWLIWDGEMDLERAATVMQAIADSQDWESLGACVSEAPDNPYD